jgi:hypothetical protein
MNKPSGRGIMRKMNKRVKLLVVMLLVAFLEGWDVKSTKVKKCANRAKRKK